MSKVNYVSELNSFMRYARDNNLSMRERMLWIALFYIANDRAGYNEQTQEYEWPDDYIQVSNGELNLYCCLDKRGIETMRNLLKQRGLIDFQPGMKNKRNPAYKIFYLTATSAVVEKPVDNPVDNRAGGREGYRPSNIVGSNNVPNNVPNRTPSNAPNNVPNHVPNHAPNYAPTSSPSNGNLGTNLHPTMPPYSRNKYINHPQAGTGYGAGQAWAEHGRNGRQASADVGFVDLSHENADCDGFVPLPWEE